MKYKQDWGEHNDMFAALSTAEKRGFEIGFRIGIRIGTDRTKKEITINAINEGVDDIFIQKITNLSLLEISEIRKEIKP